MVKVSIGISQESMVDRIIRNVGVRITRSGFATYIDKQYNGISAYMLKMKWGIGLDTENDTLQFTTQDNGISALKSLTWW